MKANSKWAEPDPAGRPVHRRTVAPAVPPAPVRQSHGYYSADSMASDDQVPASRDRPIITGCHDDPMMIPGRRGCGVRARVRVSGSHYGPADSDSPVLPGTVTADVVVQANVTPGNVPRVVWPGTPGRQCRHRTRTARKIRKSKTKFCDFC